MKFDTLASIPLEDFFIAYYQCRKRKRKTINALQFEVNYEENLVKLWREVNSRKYEIGRSICFLVTRPKLREIFAADFRDRIVHHVIMMRLEPLFEEVFIEDNYNCRKGKGTLYGVKVNANNFGQHDQVFYLYCVGTSGSIKDASAEGLVLNFN